MSVLTARAPEMGLKQTVESERDTRPKDPGEGIESNKILDVTKPLCLANPKAGNLKQTCHDVRG